VCSGARFDGILPAVPIGECFALAAALCWAIGSVLFSRIGRAVSPPAMNLVKCLTAATLLTASRIALSPSLGPVRITSGSAGLLALSAVIGLTVGDTAYFASMARIGVPRAILLLSSAPVFAAIGGAWLLGEALTARTAAGITVTLAGIAIAVTRREGAPDGDDRADHDLGAARARHHGVAFGLLAGLCQAGGSLLSRRAMADGLDPLAAAAGRVSLGGLALLASGWALRRAGPWLREVAVDRAWAKIAGASLIGTFAGIWMAQIALARAASVGVATTLLATSPVFALPLARFIGRERVGARGVLAALLAVGGVALMTLR
jgi:drug/metabolite transporter (DMT)-like permease